MIKNILLFLLMSIYIYTLTFDIFLNNFIRIPSPLITCLPLILLFGSFSSSYYYKKELFYLFTALVLYFVVGQSDLKAFLVNLLILLFCSFYFNYYIRGSIKKFKISIIIFFGYLFASTIVMLLNHLYPYEIIQLRSFLIGGEIAQSPSGITSKIFTFGYQLAALVVFIFTFSLFFQKKLLTIGVAFLCLISIFYGMQRSVLLVFVITTSLALINIYKKKALIIIGLVVISLFSLTPLVLELTSREYDNILSKNERNEEENRDKLITENLAIYSDYPFGLIFYGKNWGDVTKDNLVFKDGLTSHNAHLLFITYLGPILAVVILYGLYKNIWLALKRASIKVKDKVIDNNTAIQYSLILSFVAASLNSMFHNAWLIEANGPSVFLFFAALHFNKLTSQVIS